MLVFQRVFTSYISHFYPWWFMGEIFCNLCCINWCTDIDGPCLPHSTKPECFNDKMGSFGIVKLYAFSILSFNSFKWTDGIMSMRFQHLSHILKTARGWDQPAKNPFLINSNFESSSSFSFSFSSFSFNLFWKIDSHVLSAPRYSMISCNTFESWLSDNFDASESVWGKNFWLRGNVNILRWYSQCDAQKIRDKCKYCNTEIFNSPTLDRPTSRPEIFVFISWCQRCSLLQLVSNKDIFAVWKNKDCSQLFPFPFMVFSQKNMMESNSTYCSSYAILEMKNHFITDIMTIRRWYWSNYQALIRS